MIRLSTLFILFLFLLSGITQNQTDPQEYLTRYKEADKLFHTAENYEARTGSLAGEEKMNREALNLFLKIIPIAEANRNDSLAFHCYFRTAILYHYFDSLDLAKKFYLKAINSISTTHPVPDSFYFKPYLFAGSVYYSIENFDSALFHYNKADEILNRFKAPLQESERLYNRLGALYFETGNYSQAKNYFEKASAVLGSLSSVNRDLFVYYKNNIATALLKLQEYKAAMDIYKSILPFGVRKNEILNNIGFIQLELNEPGQALVYFRQIKDTTARKIQVYNHIGRAYLDLGKNDSARFHFSLAEMENKKWNGTRTNILNGLTKKYTADLLFKEGSYSEAVSSYHTAIKELSPGFNKQDIYENPASFSGVFSYINLFNTLSGKAAAFETWFNKDKDIKYLKASLQTYHAAFDLASYVEKTYNSDEARVFLNKIKYTAHNNPIQLSLRLYELTNNKKYIEEAFYFDQLNKASILSLNTEETNLRKNNINDSSMLRKESFYKTTITRLSLKLASLTDSVEEVKIRSTIRDYEIELGKVEEKINMVVPSKATHIADRIPAVDDVKKMLDETTALISYHLSGDKIVIMVLTGKDLSYHEAAIDNLFYQYLDSLRKILNSPLGIYRTQIEALSSNLYATLIAPVQNQLSSLKRLIIIPDDELHYLPFDLLMNTNKNYLIEKYSIQYLYSTALLNTKENLLTDAGTVSFAPFIQKSFTEGRITFNRLPATVKEIENLSGKTFIDSTATKTNFLKNVNSHGILHLATHAQVNTDDPNLSFIAFYPSATDSMDRLYAQEIYDLKLDSTRLVILSACETGTGQLVKGEGLMSLSRAFAYAGCPNVITSLWKASDQSTAIIISRLHYYLSRGFTPDIALQKAKIDLLRNTTVDPRFKQPAYWAHLVSIGNYTPIKHGLRWRWVAISTIAMMLLYYFTKKRVTKKLNVDTTNK